jgi:hypothetical protein
MNALRRFFSRGWVKAVGFVLSVLSGATVAAASVSLPWWGRVAVGVGFALAGFGIVSGGTPNLQPPPPQPPGDGG